LVKISGQFYSMYLCRKYYQFRNYLRVKGKVIKWRLFFFKKAVDGFWKLRFGLWAFVIVSLAAYFLLWKGDKPVFNLNDDETWKNLGSELHGLIFDIILFGIVLVFFERVREKRDVILRYLEELDDYRGWDSQEAYHRNHGIIRRLINEKFYRIDMTDICLKNQKIYKPLNFEFSLFRRSLLDNAEFMNSFFISASFIDISAFGTRFYECRFESCTFSSPRFRGTEFFLCEFTNTSFHGIGVIEANRPTVYFNESKFNAVDFKYFNVYSITGFKNCSFVGCEAFEFQREHFKKLGVEASFTYLPNPQGFNQRMEDEKTILDCDQW
jgi:hypothetical protein